MATDSYIGVKVAQWCGLMGTHIGLGHVHDKLMRDTAKVAGIEPTGEWEPAKGVSWSTSPPPNDRERCGTIQTVTSYSSYTLGGVQPCGMADFTSSMTRKNTGEPRGARCITIGLAWNYPGGSLSVRTW